MKTQLSDELLERFLSYVKIDTQSSEESTTYPSTEKQNDLLRLLVSELQSLGLKDAVAMVARKRISDIEELV